MNLELDCKGFEDYLEDKEALLGGVRYVFRFDNEYGASIIKHKGSYGHECDLWELAVLYRGRLCYSTKITDDVVGYLTNEGVRELLQRIKEL